MNVNDILLWLGCTVLAVWSMEIVGQVGAMRAHGRPLRALRPALTLLLTVVALGLAAWLLLPAFSGWILTGIEALVLAPSLAFQRATAAFEQQRLAAALRWADLSAMLLPLPFHLRQVAQLRTMVRILRGEAPIEAEAPPGADASPAPGPGVAAAGTWADPLRLFRWSVAGRWKEIAEALASVPVQGEPVRITLVRFRSCYEIKDFDAALAAYERLQVLVWNPQASSRRMLIGARLLLLTAAGLEQQVGQVASALKHSPERREAAMAWAAWAAGQEAEARGRLEVLLRSGNATIRYLCSARLADPPALASALPARWLELAKGLAEDRSWYMQTPVRTVPALVAINVAAFGCTLLCARTFAAAGAADPLASALRTLGALSTPYQPGNEWRLAMAMFLHAGYLHLGLNMLGLIAIGPRVERSLGAVRFLVLYLVAGLGGNLVFDMVDTIQGNHNELVGASGCIMGVFGALLVERLRFFLSHRQQGWTTLRMGLFLLILQWVFDASHPEVAGLAHFAGLTIGALCAWWLLPRQAPAATPA